MLITSWHRKLFGSSRFDADSRALEPPDGATGPPSALHWTVAFITLALGSVANAVSLRMAGDDARFVPAAIVLTLVWLAGAAIIGPGSLRTGQHWLRGAAAGLLLCGAFLAGALAVRYLPALRAPVTEVLDHSSAAPLVVVAAITVAAGAAEELFFRGALFRIVRRRPVVVTTLSYAATVVPAGNIMLVLAALIVGAITGFQRQLTGGVLVPVLTHAVWGLTMLLVLPPLLG